MKAPLAFALGFLIGIALIGLPVLVTRWANPRTELVATRTVRLVDRRTGAEIILPPGAEIIKVKNSTGAGSSDYPFDGLLRFSLDAGDTALQPVSDTLKTDPLPVLKHERPTAPAVN